MAAAAPLSPAKADVLGDQYSASASQFSASDPVRVDLVRATKASRTLDGERVTDPSAQQRLAAEGKLITDAGELALAADTVNKYIVHGHSPVDRTVFVNNRFDKRLDFHPVHDVASQFADQNGNECHIVHITNDYTKNDNAMFIQGEPAFGDMPSGDVWVDTPLIRAGILIHEDAHCRVVPFLGLHASDAHADAAKADGDDASYLDHTLAATVKTIVTENISDAAALFMIARRDGLDAALSFGGDLHAIRTHEDSIFKLELSGLQERGKLDEPQQRIGMIFDHNTVQTIEAVLSHLKTHGVPASDRYAWELSVRMGTEHGLKTAVQEMSDAKLSFNSESLRAQTLSDIDSASRLSIDAYSNADLRPDPDGQDAIQRINTSGMSMISQGATGVAPFNAPRPKVPGEDGLLKPADPDIPVLLQMPAATQSTQNVSPAARATQQMLSANRLTSMLLKPAAQSKTAQIRLR
jgi:hypothetical protein